MPDAPTTSVYLNAAGELLTHPGGFLVLRYLPGPWEQPALDALLTEAGAWLLRHHWQRLLVDARQLPTLSPALKEWLAVHWMGGRIARPHRLRIALVQPTQALARLAVAEVRSQGSGDGGYAYFTTPEEAFSHLAALPR
jgi:hypothetical protein